MIHICTYFDFNFLPRGIALYNSIKKFHSEFKFYVLAFDTETYDYLTNLNDSRIVPISFQTYNSFFNTSIDNYEDKKEYYFSATPNICIYLLNQYPDIDILLYLDADVYLFSSLEPLYNEFGNNSIGICPHRLHPLVKLLTKNHGIYNVGVNLFRNNSVGKKCLNEWKLECESWYKGKSGYHLNYFSDQIFLDKWPERCSEVKVIQHIGIDVAPWNAANYKFRKENNILYVNDYPVIIYHFSSLKRIAEKKWNANTIIYMATVKSVLLEMYISYIKEVELNDRSDKFATIPLSKSLWKRIFYWVMQIFLNEKIYF
ncbi:MAG: glycosyltransferase [Bacteroidales bacterium]